MFSNTATTVESAANEQEEERAPELPKPHLRKHVGQGHEHEARAASRIDAKGKTSGKDDEAGHERNDGIEYADRECLPEDAALLTQIAAEDLHGANADGEREEALSHRGVDDLRETRGAIGEHLGEIRHEVEGQAALGTRQRNRADNENEKDHEQRAHHEFGNAFDTLVHAKSADEHAYHAHDDCPNHDLTGVCEHRLENAAHLGRVQAIELAGRHLDEVVEHPARHAGIEHHEHEVADETHPAHEVPLGASRLKHVKGARNGLLACTAHRILEAEHRQAKKYEKKDI